MNGHRARFPAWVLVVLTVAGWGLLGPLAYAIDPDTPIVNVATASWVVGGSTRTASGSHTLVSAGAPANEAPTDIELTSAAVPPETPGAVVGTLSSVDPNNGDTHTYAVDDPRFEVVDAELKLADGEMLAVGEVLPVTVTTTDAGGLTYTETFQIAAMEPASSGDGAAIVFLQHAPGVPGLPQTNVAASQCRTGAGDVAMAAPLALDGTLLGLPAALPLRSAGLYKSDETLFVQVSDASANTDSGVVETVLIELSTASGEREQLLAAETAVDSGVFVGYIASARPGTVSTADCQLTTGINERVVARYVDPLDATDIATAAALVDPLGVVFDSATGTPIDGVTVTLIDAATGQPAVVFGDNATDRYPATVVTGTEVTDAGGARYQLGPGEFRFPFVASGDYRLQIEPPNRFVFPSLAADSALQVLPGGPYALGPASRGEVFNVPVGPAVRVDIPLDLSPIVPTPSAITLLALAPADPDAQLTQVSGARCLAGADLVAAPLPQTLVAGPLSLPAAAPLQNRGRYSRGDAVFIEVVDADQDLDAFAVDRLLVTLSVRGESDSETVELQETGASTGRFTGYIQTGIEAPVANDCVLGSNPGAEFDARYQDPDDSADSVSATALLDPAFSVFSSVNGAAVDGLEVTLIDAATGQPALGSVFAADGSTPFPVTVTVGGQATDSAGGTISFASGTFRFPVIAAGSYRLRFAVDGRYQYPSGATNAQLDALAGGPFELLAGSRGETFVVAAGVATGFDIPLDPVGGELSLVKEVSKEVAAIGDFLQYRITVTNAASAATVSGATLTDWLPKGLRYVPGSGRFENIQTPAVVTVDDNARSLLLALPELAPGDSQTLRYVVEVAAGTPLGLARNRVALTGSAAGRANEAFVDVLIRDELFTRDTFILGRISQGACAPETPNPGVAGVRVYLEDGRYAVTDAEGKYHFEGVNAGTHVVQVDQATIPAGTGLQACDDDSRSADQTYSRFVDVAAGSLWRADFYLEPQSAESVALTSRLQAVAADGLVSYRYELRSPSLPLTKTRATVMLSPHLVFAPGSARINGEPVADPEGVALGALTFRLPDTEDGFEATITFDTLVTNASFELETKAIVTTMSAGAVRRAPVISSVLSLDWPASLIEIARDRLRLAYPDKELVAANRSQAQANAPAGKLTAPSSKLQVGAKVYEPSRSGIHSDSGVALLPLAAAEPTAPAAPYVIPEVDEGHAPQFGRSWLQSQQPGFELVWPPENYNPRIPSIAVAIKHPPGERPLLQVDGELVNNMTFEGTVSDTKRGVAVSLWQNVPISETDSVIRASAGDLYSERAVHFGGAPISAELVPELSYLVADGITPPMLAVRLRDRKGQQARPGITGEYGIDNPYEPFNDARLLDQLSPGGREGQGLNRYRVRKDGIAYIQLEPTTVTGMVTLRFSFGDLRAQQVRARLQPGERDWILIGLVEGTFGKTSRGGAVSEIEDSNLQDATLQDGRVAFFAKGMIKGQWLLTAAYDTDKETERRLREQIDPGQFYTLYGDGSEQRFDAQSQQKLYLKVEKERFSALFGDYDTGFDRTEYTRYARTLNGLQGQYYGDKVRVDAFASETAQGFVRESLAGDGTSGIYRLAQQQLVVNSERISIVTRNRFRQEEELERRSLVRYLDYSIDYDRGTLLFKQPVFAQDPGFNPIFIEVEYEIDPGGARDDLVAGVRAAVRLDDADSELAATYIHDDSLGNAGSLIGLDVDWQLPQGLRLQAEVARTSTDTADGDALRFELERTSANMAGELFYRQQDGSFGLGQQTVFTSGLRSFGVTGEYRLDESWLLRGEAYQQQDLDTEGERTVIGLEAEYRRNDARYRAGVRSVSEQVAAGGARDASQVVAGVSQRMLDNRLTLRADAEVSVGGDGDNTDYPSRVVLGADYDLYSNLTLIGEQEFTFGDERNTQDTRLGLKTRPWAGADFNTGLQRELTENGERVFATTGLIQQWRLNERWFFDFGADRTQTLSQTGSTSDVPALTFRPVNQPASGSFSEDFTAFFSGVGYRREQWDVSSRLEFHLGDLSDKWNWLAGANRQLSDGKIMSASLSVLNDEQANGTLQNSADLRFGLAWRPVESSWLYLNRLDLNLTETRNGSFDVRSRKIVDNFHANYRPSERSQLSLQLGLKYVMDSFDGEEFSGLTGLYGAEYRRDLGRRFDFGVRGAALQSFEAGSLRYSAGLSVGVSPFKNTWLSLGYNFVGFSDDDFADAEYTARGLYLKIRLKLDQDLIRRFTAPVAPSDRVR
ncbi:MAG: hypothetical protein AB8B93_08870 [Pseudomonadales bacterium]